MDYLDPKKQKAHLVRLTIGYILVVVALILTTIILLYHAYGFGLKNGEVIQNGLIFVSSRPDPADIYVNGKKHDETTNSRLLMAAGQYTFELKRDGYRPWKRAINIEGGSVVRFDYPMLFPTKLTTTATKRYDVRPTIITQSPDHRWLLVQGVAAYNSFDLFDLNDPQQPVQPFTIPETFFGLKGGTHSWELVEWSNNNRHVLLKHITDVDGAKTSEYVLLDREKPEESVNLTQKLGINPTKLELREKKFDKYLIFNESEATLSTSTLDDPTPKLLLENVLAYKMHDDDVILYVTAQGSPVGKADVKLLEDDKTYPIRQVATGGKYLLEIARYENAWYVVAGASNEGRTYVYKNPAAALNKKPKTPLVPIQVLKAPNATYVSFSDNARFIMAQGGQQFAVYDAETDRGYAYTVAAPMQAPQEHAKWMDGHRMMFVSNGKTLVYDFDNANKEILTAADAAYVPVFDRNYEFLYSINPQVVKNAEGQESTQFVLNSTALLAERDQ